MPPMSGVKALRLVRELVIVLEHAERGGPHARAEARGDRGDARRMAAASIAHCRS